MFQPGETIETANEERNRDSVHRESLKFSVSFCLIPRKGKQFTKAARTVFREFRSRVHPFPFDIQSGTPSNNNRTKALAKNRVARRATTSNDEFHGELLSYSRRSSFSFLVSRGKKNLSVETEASVFRIGKRTTTRPSSATRIVEKEQRRDIESRTRTRRDRSLRDLSPPGEYRGRKSFTHRGRDFHENPRINFTRRFGDLGGHNSRRIVGYRLRWRENASPYFSAFPPRAAEIFTCPPRRSKTARERASTERRRCSFRAT